MADYISREAAIEALRPYKVDPFKIGFLDDTIDGFNDGIDTAISALSVMPAADVRPVVRAHWIMPNADGTDRPMPECSHCGWYVDNGGVKDFSFCPNCGADMREVTADG